MVRIRAQRQPDASRHTHLVTFPREVSHKAVLAFVDALSGLEKPKPLLPLHSVVFETYADSDGFKHLLSVPSHVVASVDGWLRTHIPGSRLTALKANEDFTPGVKWDQVGEYGSTSRSKRLHIALPEGTVATILTSFADLKPGEACLMQWVVASAPHQESEDDKHKGHVFYASLRLAAKGEDANHRLRRLYSGLSSTHTYGMKFRRVWWIPTNKVKDRVRRRVNPLGFSIFLSTEELAAVLAFPIGDPNIPGRPMGRARHLPADREIPMDGIKLGRSNYPGDSRLLSVTPQQLTRHAHVLGPQGSGKTTTAINMFVQGMNQGLGMTFIDPHGDAALDILNRVPKHRLDDVVWFNPMDTEQSIGLNVLAGDPYDATDQVLSIFDKLAEVYKLPQTADVLRSSVLTLAQQGMTLMELPVLLGVDPQSKAFRERMVGNVTDRALKNFWHWYNTLTTAKQVDATAPVLRRLRPFEQRPSLRACLGQTGKGMDLSDIINNNKILIASLSKGQLKEEPSKLFGSLLVSKLWEAILARANMKEEDRPIHLVFIDEFASYTNLPMNFGDALAEARKFKAGFILLHQYLNQLPPYLRESVAPNTATKIMWALAANDAAAMSRELGGTTTPTDHQMLVQHEVIIKFPDVSHPVTADAMGPVPPTGLGAEAKRRSGEKYGRTMAEVEAEMAARQGEKKPRKPPKIGWVKDE